MFLRISPEKKTYIDMNFLDFVFFLVDDASRVESGLSKVGKVDGLFVTNMDLADEFFIFNFLAKFLFFQEIKLKQSGY